MLRVFITPSRNDDSVEVVVNYNMSEKDASSLAEEITKIDSESSPGSRRLPTITRPLTGVKRLRDDDKGLRPTVRLREGEELVIEYELVPEGLGGSIAAGASAFIARFYDITGRYPTVKEAALEFGATPQQTEKTLYETAPSTKWRPPSEMEIENVERQLGGALYVAALLKKKGKWTGKKTATPQEIKKAQYLSENYPDLVPQYDHGVLKWPETVKRYMTRNYDPNTRAVVF